MKLEMKLEMKGTSQCSTHTILTGNFICNVSEKQCFLIKQSFQEEIKNPMKQNRYRSRKSTEELHLCGS